MRKWIKSELMGWRPAEAAWLAAAVIITLGLSLYWHDTAVGIIAAVTGVVCVVLTGKGKLSSYIFGMVNTLLYAYVAFGAKYYGEVMLNLIYYVPMNIVGFVLWRRHMNEDGSEVVKQRLRRGWQFLLIAVSAAGVYLYGLFLKGLGGSLPFVDSLSTVMSIVAQFLCVRRYMEQWVVWIVVDVVTVIMWAVEFARGGESIATLIMWSVYLINAVIMFIKWYRASRSNPA